MSDGTEGEVDVMCVANRTDCPKERGWEAGYGMAGGGMGVYTYCTLCHRIVDKVQDRDDEG